MVAQRMSVVQESLADTLAALKELVKDPSAIAAAHDEARKQIALTAEEKQKADEGRSFIKQYDLLLADINKQKDALDAAKKQHADYVEEQQKLSSERFDTLVSMLEKEYETKKQELEAKSKELDSKLSIHIQNVSEYKRSLADLDTAKTKLESDKIYNNKKSVELKDLEDALLAKETYLAATQAELDKKHAALKSILG